MKLIHCIIAAIIAWIVIVTILFVVGLFLLKFLYY